MPLTLGIGYACFFVVRRGALLIDLGKLIILFVYVVPHRCII